jgi:hypothetical protein
MNRPLYCLRFNFNGERRDTWFSSLDSAETEKRRIIREAGGKVTDTRILQFTFPDVNNKQMTVRAAVLYGLKKLGGPHQQQLAFERVASVDETDAALSAEDLADSMDVDSGRGMLAEEAE